MSGILWNEIVFGPIKSRRLGSSLGINLLPEKLKICSFNCVYCECGWGENVDNITDSIYSHSQIITAFEERLKELKTQNIHIDSFTFAGNGEPTMHPEFSIIVNDIVRLRDKYYPNTITTCLSNSTFCGNAEIRDSLLKLDNPLMKLDAGTQEMYDRINRPFKKIKLDEIVDNLIKFEGKLSIQTLFLRGEYNGFAIDNTTDEEIKMWLEKIVKINPKKVLLYPIERATPAHNLQKISAAELELIAQKVRILGFETLVY